MRPLRLPLLLALPLLFSACDSLNPDADEVRRGFIERVVINDFPPTQPNGTGWDGGGDSQADVYFLLLGVNANDIIVNGEEDGVIATEDATPNDGIYQDVGSGDTPLSYRLDNPLVVGSEITVLDRRLRLQVKDDDGGVFNTDEVMSTSSEFNLFDQIPSTLPNDRRVTFTVTSTDGEMEARITVRYER